MCGSHMLGRFDVLEITVAEVVYAAAVLEKMSELYGLFPESGAWSPKELRAELPYIEDIEKQQRARRQVIADVEDLVDAGQDLVDALYAALSKWELTAVEE